MITTAFLKPGGEVDSRLQEAGARVIFIPKPNEEPGRFRKALGEADAVIAGTHPVTAEMIDAAPFLRVIARTGVGYDNVDVDAASRHGVAVCVTPGANRQAVAEHVFALMLAAARDVPDNIAEVTTGKWTQRSGRELSGATLGIVGLGSIGKTVALLGRAFGMRVVAYDPYFDSQFGEDHDVKQVELGELLSIADFITLHLFLDSTTKHLIDAQALARTKPGAIVINTARGGIIDENALADAVRSGGLGGAGLDVFETEPLPVTSPLVGLPRVITTGHVAGATQEARTRSGLLAAEIVLAALKGDNVPHSVNGDKLTVSAGIA
nr:phosphoglycerate dehydrogenase [Diaminobutyricibacter tongyongensis]